MALSGSCVVKATGQNNLIFSWGAVQDTAANASVVSWQLLLEAGQFGRIDATPGSPWSATVAGKAFSGTTSLAIGNNESKVLCSGQVTVSHNADGSGGFDFAFTQEFWIQFGSEYITVVTGSGSAALDPIARASVPTLSVSAAQMGSTLTIFTNRADSSLTHTLEYRFGNTSGSIAQGVGDLCPWTPPIELAWQIPSAVSGTAVISCTTYAGGTAIGTKEVTVVLTVPESIVPEAAATWEDASGAYSAEGALAQGVSRLDVAVSGTGVYGSTITGAAVMLNGKSYGGGTITDSGELPLTVSVTDSRGRVGYGHYTITVAAYAPPRLSLSASRCNADGTADDTGDHAKITVAGEISPVGSNSAALRLTWGGSTETVSGTSWEKVVPADPNATMTITAVLSDKLVSSSRTMVLSTGYATLDLLAGGKGISFGKAATREGFDCAMPAYFSGGIYGIAEDGTVDERSLPERVASLEGKTIIGGLETPGWYRVGILYDDNDFLVTATARMSIGTSFQYHYARPAIVDIAFDYHRGYFQKVFDNVNGTHISKIRMCRLDNSSCAVDVYYPYGEADVIQITVYEVQGKFTANESFVNVSDSTETVWATLDMNKVQNTRTDLLWVNATPGLAIPPQTIPLDLSGYDAVEVVASVGELPSPFICSAKVPIGQSGMVCGFGIDYWYHARCFSVTATGIEFTGGYMREPSGAIYENWAGRSVPYKIYGIKEGQ